MPENKKAKKKQKKDGTGLKEEHLFNSDLSWLEFNSRVLHEATDPRTPLAERFRFCDIFRSNTDEFFQKRVGALHYRLKSQAGDEAKETLTKELLEKITNKVKNQTTTLSKSFVQDLLPNLEKKGTKLLKWEELILGEKNYITTLFRSDIFPILTPLAVDAGHPFPFLSNLSKSIGVVMKNPDSGQKSFARIKIPEEIPQWLELKKDGKFSARFINIEEVVRNNLQSLFPNMEIEGSMIFRITRNAAIEEDHEHEADNLREFVKEELRERKFAPIVRLEYEKNPDAWILEFLKDELHLKDISLFEMPSMACYAPLRRVCQISDPAAYYTPFTSTTNPYLLKSSEEELNIFDAIRKKDCLIHCPYESFSSSIVKFVNDAANDPQVRAIKITLYRTDDEGKLVSALIRAAENKKQAACIIELKAKFNEEANIRWADKMRKAGIYVSYGVVNLKTHSKLIMVVRQEDNELRTYTNISTGNYHAVTSQIYTDISYFTAKKGIGSEVIDVFNLLSGRSLKKDYRSLWVAPFNMRERFLTMIEKEIKHHKESGKGLIIAKCNSLDDHKVIKALYQASGAGVQIILIVRGFCTLKPGVKGLSDNIKVFSIVGRFLEHSRIYFFRLGQDNPKDSEYFIGSSDLRTRSFIRRIEVIVPVKEKDLRQKLWDYLQLCISDNRHLWELQEDGSYRQRKPSKAEGKSKEIDSQGEMIKK